MIADFLGSLLSWTHLDAGANHVCIQPLNPDGSRLPDLKALEVLAL